VFVVQDGTAAGTKAVIDSFGIRCHQKTAQQTTSRYFNSASARIALHYRYALDHMFDVVTDVRRCPHDCAGVCCVGWAPSPCVDGMSLCQTGA
jgi:hypothetical protein